MRNILILCLLILQTCTSKTQYNNLDGFEPNRIDSSLIVIDGILGEPEWNTASRINSFFELYTNNQPQNKTEAFILYDSAQLYVAFKAFVNDISLLTQNHYPKDDERNASGEWVAVCLDSYADGLNAVFFISNPSGGQIDGNLDMDGSPNMTFSTKWNCTATVNDNHYVVEMAIPFRDLPFDWQKDSVKMSFKLVRFDAANGAEYDYPKFSRGNASHLSQFEQISLKNIAQNQPKNKTGIDINELYKSKLARTLLFDTQTLNGRSNAWGDASVIDYKVFKKSKLYASSKPFHFEYDLKKGTIAAIFTSLNIEPLNRVKDFEHFLERTNTSSFIVIKDDKILFEKYYNGFSRDSLSTSFSIAKSITSILVGMAIDDGFIKSDQEPITRWIPELADRDKRFEQISIRDLISMSSGLRYEEEGNFRDDEITYYHPDLRKAALAETEIQESAGSHFLYNNYNPLLVGLLLERAVGKPLTEYVQKKLWEPLGMEYDGSWSTDEQSFEKMESGINARSIDFAKIGRLMLTQGNWQGNQLLSKNWVEVSTQKIETSSSYYPTSGYFDEGGYYGFFWWGIERKNGKDDFFGMGNKGQYLYVCPQKNLIIIRNGITYGLPSMRWPRIFYEFAEKLSN